MHIQWRNDEIHDTSCGHYYEKISIKHTTTYIYYWFVSLYLLELLPHATSIYTYEKKDKRSIITLSILSFTNCFVWIKFFKFWLHMRIWREIAPRCDCTHCIFKLFYIIFWYIIYIIIIYLDFWWIKITQRCVNIN